MLDRNGRFDLWGPFSSMCARMIVAGIPLDTILAVAQESLRKRRYTYSKRQIDPALRQRSSAWSALVMERGAKGGFLADVLFRDTLSEIPFSSAIPGLRDLATHHSIILASRDLATGSNEVLFRLEDSAAYTVNPRYFASKALEAIVTGLEAHGAAVVNLEAVSHRKIPSDYPISLRSLFGLQEEARAIRWRKWLSR